MNAARRGKIARLPHGVREQLNSRMFNAEAGIKLVAWLNTLPEVQAVLAADFGGRPVHSVRFWALTGRLGKEALAGNVKPDPTVTETFAYWVTARYAFDTVRVDAAEGDARWRLLREMSRDIVALRRGDHRALQMEIERQRREQGHGARFRPSILRFRKSG